MGATKLKRGKYKFRGRRQRTDPVGLQVSCYGKIRWTKEEAQRHAENINQHTLIGDRKVRPYRCKNCSTRDKKVFHVGREPKKEVQ